MFFFMYHMNGVTWESVKKMKIFERKWYIERFIEQKDKENEAQAAANRKH